VTTDPAVTEPERHKDVDDVLEEVIAARRAGTDPKDLFGGPRDMVDSMAPSAAFILSNIALGWRRALLVALAVEVVVVVVRLVRKETLRHAFSGAFGVALSAVIVAKTHKVGNYFLVGIFTNVAYGLVFLVSALVGHPLVGVIMRLLSEKPKAWHRHPRVKRAYIEATYGWAAVFLLRVAVQEPLRRADQVVLLFIAKYGMGYPLYLAALALTKPYVDRRTRDVPVPDPDPAEDGVASAEAAEPEAEPSGTDAAADAP
jgi:MFS family permease